MRENLQYFYMFVRKYTIICLQCFDISNKTISCICILPKVEYLNGMWLFKEYSLRYYSPCAQQPYCKNPKCKVKQIPYLQFHDSGIQLMINKLNKEYENDGNNSNSQNMDNSIDVDINDGNTNFVENHQKNNSPAQLSKRQRITLENGFKANPNEYDDVVGEIMQLALFIIVSISIYFSTFF